MCRPTPYQLANSVVLRCCKSVCIAKAYSILYGKYRSVSQGREVMMLTFRLHYYISSVVGIFEVNRTLMSLNFSFVQLQAVILWRAGKYC